MPADILPRITLANRTALETVIPLSTPYLVFLDPSNVCNFQCKFCPTGNRDLVSKFRYPEVMELDTFKKAVDDLAAMPEPIKTLRMYKDGEPLLNPLFCEMVEYAKLTGRFKSIDTTTNGSLLSKHMNFSLIDSGLDRIFISVPQNYAEGYIAHVRHLYIHSRGKMEILVKIVGDGLSEFQKEQFMEDFRNISDKIFIEHIAACWPSFEVQGVNQEVGIYGQELKEVQVCPYIFYSLAINSDGKVSLCFLDWNRQLVIGDIKVQSFSDIWNGGTLRYYRMLHLRKRRWTQEMCRKCGQLSYGAPDDIDRYAEELLRRVEK